MVGSLEADIEGVCNVQFDNQNIIDDFDDENTDEKAPHHFHKMEVRLFLLLCSCNGENCDERNTTFYQSRAYIYLKTKQKSSDKSLEPNNLVLEIRLIPN